MEHGAILLVCALLASVSSLASCNQVFDDQNVDWDRLTLNYRNQVDRQITENILLSLNIEDNELLSDVEEKIKDYVCTTNYDKTVLKDLKSFADLDKTCTQEVIDRVLQICMILHHNNDGNLNGLANFLMSVGHDKFGRCTLMLVEELENGSAANKMGENRLDNFFATSFGLSHGNEDDLLRALKTLDLRYSQFDVGKGIQFFKDMNYYSGNALADFSDIFMRTSCSNLLRDRSTAMTIISLADTFGYIVESSKVAKLIEYHRLCLSLQRVDLAEKAMANLNRHNTEGH